MLDKALDSIFAGAQTVSDFSLARFTNSENPVTELDSNKTISHHKITTLPSEIKNTLPHISNITTLPFEIKTKVETILKTALDAIHNHASIDQVSNACLSLSQHFISHSSDLKRLEMPHTLSNNTIIQLLDHVSPLLIKLSEKLDALNHHESGDIAADAVRSLIYHIRSPFTTTSTSSSSSSSSSFSQPILSSTLNPMTWADYFLSLIASLDIAYGVSAFLISSGSIHLLLSAYHGVFFLLAAFGILKMFHSLDRTITGGRIEGCICLIYSITEAVYSRYYQHIETISYKNSKNEKREKKIKGGVDGIHTPIVELSEQPQRIHGPLQKPFFNFIPSTEVYGNKMQ